MTSVGTSRTLPAVLRPVRGARTQDAALTAAHLVQALAQIVTIQQGRVLKAAPDLVQQVSVLPRRPQP